MDHAELERRQKIAEENINLVYAYMQKHHVKDEFVDVLFEGYWRGVLKWDESRGSLSTMVYMTMMHDVGVEVRKKNALKRSPQESVLSYNSLIDEEHDTEFIGSLSDDYDLLKHVESDDFLLWFLNTCSVRDLQMMYAYLDGENQKEIANHHRITQSQVSKTLRRIGDKILQGEPMYLRSHKLGDEDEQRFWIQKVISLL